ncbi:Cell adhesion molecule-related/down-regulated by oncogene [Taenia solium]|eukprot:TsM_000073600 transcript=TsM_000073600 gene=TsM_000073600
MKASAIEFIAIGLMSVLLNAIATYATSSASSLSSASSSDGSNVKIRIIPSIVSLPAPVTYLDGSRPELTLTCEVWPPTANISFFIAHPSIIATASGSPLALDPISPDTTGAFSISRRVTTPLNASIGGGGVAAFSNASVSLTVRGGGGENSEVWRLGAVDVHCRATTQFGSVLSAPFRVVQTRLPEVSTPSGFTNTRVQEFISGNTAFVSCRIPPGSQPPPTVQFYLNDTLISNSQKYKQVHRPNEDQVLLLINSFKTSDEGDYRCALTNPITMTVWSPEIVRLQVRTPDKPVSVRVLLPLATQDNSSAAASRLIVVREGDNVTLLCIMEGAPPPEVRTYPHNTQNSRYIMDKAFGLLHLVNVQPSDEGVFLCSTAHMSLTATLKVKPRLRLTTSPVDLRIASLDKRAEFRCSTSDNNVKPFWLFNGNPIYTPNPEVLVIESVQKSDLGLYQCIARTLTPDGRTDEWVSATAPLALYFDKVVTKVLATTKEMTPMVEMALDNFAVYLTWNVSDAMLYPGFHGDNSLPLVPPSSAQVQAQQIAFQIDYASLVRESMLNPALVGLIPPEPAVWSKTERLNKMWKHKYGFVVGAPLEPGNTYRFRVRAVAVETGVDVIPPSDWSDPVSTHHISNVAPPRITSVQPYHDGRFNVTWEYDGDVGNQSADTEPFKPDFFLVLTRPVLRSVSQSSLAGSTLGSAAAEDVEKGEVAVKNDATVHYGRYWATQVNGSDAREAFIHNLNASISYQLVVYGVKYENGARRITRFSEAKFATLPEVPGFGTFSLIRAVTENKPIFIGLGALAIIIFLVVLVLVIMCIVRQRKYRRRRRVKHNGFLTGHNDSEKHQSQSQQHQQYSQQPNQQSSTDLRTASPSVKAAQAAQAQGQAMLMGTLMRQSNFSEPPSQSQLQQFTQQQAAYMGSVMHLGYYGNHHPQHHHQSHHSLLLPATPAPGMMGSPMFHSGTLPPGMRSGGMMQQQQPHHHLQSPPPPPPAQLGGFGSQQVLNQMDGMEQATLMRDYYQQQQQQQQQLYQQHLLNQQQGQQASFMQYTANNPAAYLPSQQQQQQMMDSLSSRQHSQGYPYGGSIHSGTSLKRDPNGSLHEDSTLLARSPMSPHPPPMLGDQIPPPGYFQTPMYAQQHPLMSPPPPPPPVQMSGAAYYPGQPQVDSGQISLHNMGHHTDGESIYSYFSQQDVCHPQPHALLNPLPEENQMNLGFTDSGSQTAGLNGNSGTASPPAGGTVSGHRHHRRRRRKQQQQQSQSSAQQFGGGGEGDGFQSLSAVGVLHEVLDGVRVFQFPGHNSEQIAMMTMMEAQGRVAPSGMNGTTPPSAAGLEQSGGNEAVNQMENPRSGNQSFDRSTPSYGASPGVGVRSSLPPPSQPPPPPPAMMMMPMQMTSPVGLDSAGVAIGNPNAASSSSLSRRGGVSGVLSGAPPRIRDYSEYGIPTSTPNAGGIGSPPHPQGAVVMTTATPPSAAGGGGGGKQIPASQTAGYNTSNSNNNKSTSSGGGSMRYREGQA